LFWFKSTATNVEARLPSSRVERCGTHIELTGATTVAKCKMASAAESQ